MRATLGIAALVGAATLWLAPASLAAQDDDGPGLLLSKMAFVASSGSRVELMLEAEGARIPGDGEVAYLEGVQARVSGEGEGSLEMSCDRAEYRLDSNDFVARGRVRGRTGDGRRFLTSLVRYDHARALAAADVPVTIIDAHGRYSGGGFRYHVGEGHFQLVGGASVVQQ